MLPCHARADRSARLRHRRGRCDCGHHRVRASACQPSGPRVSGRNRHAATPAADASRRAGAWVRVAAARSARFPQAELAGTPYLLEIFATWCPHCQRMTKVLRAIRASVPQSRLAMISVTGSPYAANSTPDNLIAENQADVDAFESDVRRHVAKLLRFRPRGRQGMGLGRLSDHLHREREGKDRLRDERRSIRSRTDAAPSRRPALNALRCSTNEAVEVAFRARRETTIAGCRRNFASAAKLVERRRTAAGMMLSASSAIQPSAGSGVPQHGEIRSRSESLAIALEGQARARCRAARSGCRCRRAPSRVRAPAVPRPSTAVRKQDVRAQEQVEEVHRRKAMGRRATTRGGPPARPSWRAPSRCSPACDPRHRSAPANGGEEQASTAPRRSRNPARVRTAGPARRSARLSDDLVHPCR